MCSSHLKPSPRRGGFTLIELLIVIAIIAVLISITIPATMKAREAANRTNCANNLRQIGLAFQAHQSQYNYLPTAGLTDYAAPTFSEVGTTTNYNPYVGWRQDAGWGYQILPFLDAEPIWQGGTVANGTGSSASPPISLMQNAISPPLKIYFCPSRRQPSISLYTSTSFPYETAYKTVQGTGMTVALTDYAGCNGTVAGAVPGNGAVVSQVNGKFTVSISDIRDGTSYTLLVGEKAGNPRMPTAVPLEDGVGFFSGYGPTPSGSAQSTGGTNFNTIRFATTSLLPMRDLEVTGATGGAFGSAHTGSWNALMADGSVQQLSYTISGSVFTALGTIQGNEIISDLDLSN